MSRSSFSHNVEKLVLVLFANVQEITSFNSYLTPPIFSPERVRQVMGLCCQTPDFRLPWVGSGQNPLGYVQVPYIIH